MNILRRNIDTEEDSTTCINFWYAIKNRMYNTRYERFCLPNQKLINKNAAGRSRKSLIERNWRKLVYTTHAIRILILLYYMWASCWCKTISCQPFRWIRNQMVNHSAVIIYIFFFIFTMLLWRHRLHRGWQIFKCFMVVWHVVCTCHNSSIIFIILLLEITNKSNK